MVAIQQQRSSKLIYFISFFGCIILWITVYQPNTSSLGVEDDLLTTDEPYSNTKSLCTPESFNEGNWIHHPTAIDSPTNQTQFTQAAGYHCLKKFAHRCFRRGGDEAFRAKQM